MIEGLKPYAEYKESGLPWLDTVPKHWDMAPNRALMRDQRQVVGARASDYTLLSLTLRGVIARDMVNPKGKFPAQFNTYKVVKPDDFVFCLFDIDETPRGVGLSPLKGMITGAYDIFSPTHRINPRFLYHYYLFVDEGKLMKPLYTGLRKTIQRGVFASLKAPLPPPEEQTAIVRFLDHANRKIDGFIRAKRKLIGLLNEQKQAIIHRAVTRGLQPDVPLKPSGIPWLGDIPKHWEVLPLGRVLVERKESNDPIKTKNILSLSLHDGVVPYAEKTRPGGNKAKDDLTAYKLAYPGDIVVNSMNVVVGSVGLSRYFGAVSPVYYMLRPRQGKDTVEYFDSIFHDVAFQRSLFGLGNGIMVIQSKSSGKLNTIRMRIPMGKLNRVEIPYPPPSEQQAIVAGIGTEIAPVTTAIARTEREIALMQEYRTRLTADLVTGKLDVREAAAHLPALPTAAPVEPATDEPVEEVEPEEAE
jgi:type I restriction enzyme S subunit